MPSHRAALTTTSLAWCEAIDGGRYTGVAGSSACSAARAGRCPRVIILQHHDMTMFRRIAIGALIATSLAACAESTPDDGFVRGPGLRVATLPVAARVAIYDAAVREAFDVGPSLSLMLAERFLPRTTGLEGGAPVPKDLADALRARGVVRGSCRSLPGAEKGAAVCDARDPGYIVQFSEIFRVRGDTVQVHLATERYNTPTSAALEVMRFEKAYQLVGSGTNWRVARAGRVTMELRAVPRRDAVVAEAS